jgi:hypothetical protein
MPQWAARPKFLSTLVLVLDAKFGGTAKPSRSLAGRTTPEKPNDEGGMSISLWFSVASVLRFSEFNTENKEQTTDSKDCREVAFVQFIARLFAVRIALSANGPW